MQFGLMDKNVLLDLLVHVINIIHIIWTNTKKIIKLFLYSFIPLFFFACSNELSSNQEKNPKIDKNNVIFSSSNSVGIEINN